MKWHAQISYKEGRKEGPQLSTKFIYRSLNQLGTYVPKYPHLLNTAPPPSPPRRGTCFKRSGERLEEVVVEVTYLVWKFVLWMFFFANQFTYPKVSRSTEVNHHQSNSLDAQVPRLKS